MSDCRLERTGDATKARFGVIVACGFYQECTATFNVPLPLIGKLQNSNALLIDSSSLLRDRQVSMYSASE